MAEQLGTRWAEMGRHPSEDDLLLFVDEELEADTYASVKAHLGACWSCRVELGKIQETISEFIQYRNQVLRPLVPPRQRQAGFRTRLHQLELTAGRKSWWAQMRDSLSRFLPHARLAWPRFAWSVSSTRIAVASLMLLLLAVAWLRLGRESVVTATELLERATEAQTQKILSASQPVIHQQLQIRRKRGGLSEVKTARIETWNDLNNTRFRQIAGDESSDLIATLAEIYRANRLDWRRPLSAVSFAEWRKSLAGKKEEVVKARLADGPEALDALNLSTTATGRTGAGAVREATLMVRSRDWHPVRQTLKVSEEAGEAEYEIIETAFEVVSLSSVHPAIFAEPAVASASPTPVAPSPSPAVKTAPAAAIDLDAAEIEVRDALHRLRADLGEPIEIVRQSTGQYGEKIEVRGLVNTAERKAELLAALDDIPGVKATIRTVKEASGNRASAAAQPSPSQTAAEPGPENAGGRLPAQELLERHFSQRFTDPDDLRTAIEQFSKQALDHSESALAEAWALRRLAERYTTAEVNRLNDASRRRLEAMVRNHLASLRLHITRTSTLVKPALGAIANESSGATAAGSGWEAAWPEFSAPLLKTVQQLDRLTTALFTISANARISPSGAARELLGAFALLESQLPDLEKRVAGEFLGVP